MTNIANGITKYYMILLTVAFLKVFPPDTSTNNTGITEVAMYA